MIVHILLDLDNVLVNFTKGAAIAHGKSPDYVATSWNFFKDDWGMSTQEFWAKIHATKDFWTNLEEFPWTDQLLDLVKQRDWTIVTRPSLDASCYAEKRRYLQNKFGFDFDDAIFTRKKWLLANNDTLLIDDSDDNVQEFYDYGGHAILFPAYHNANAKYAEDPMSYVLDQFKLYGLVTESQPA